MDHERFAPTTYQAEGTVTRVVIAEDHPLMREQICLSLEGFPNIVVAGEAGDGLEAMLLVDRLRPDVVLMDVEMPYLNGIEATRRIKSSYPGVSILALTADDDDYVVLALWQAGASGYLTKTVRSDQLAASVLAVQAGLSVFSPAVIDKLFLRAAARRPL